MECFWVRNFGLTGHDRLNQQVCSEPFLIVLIILIEYFCHELLKFLDLLVDEMCLDPLKMLSIEVC